MRLGEKIRYLREVEGALRGLSREMTQQEVVRAVKKELRKPISQSYLSQIESGARPHLTNSTRLLLAKFFKVHPGYLVDDPEGFQTGLISDLGAFEDKLDLWLIDGAERFRREPAAALRPASIVPTVSVAHWVVWVSELAAWSSPSVAMSFRNAL
jgi:transcriptional regulator with XRE-family HTH domain